MSTPAAQVPAVPGPAVADPGVHTPEALPAYFEFTAPPGWRSIDFISDLHLSEALPRTFEAFAAHLLHTPAEAVFILGDLFDVWVGDDVVSRPFEQRCLDLLAEASSHRQLALMVGNRDFLIGSAFLRAAGLTGLADPTVLSLWGQRVLLTHGDALCLADAPYQAFRRQVRSRAWQQDFLARPLDERLALAAQMRAASQARRAFDGNADADVDVGTAVRWMHAQGAAEMVHGHTHRPGSQTLAPGFKRHVLSDWDLDHGNRAEVLRLTRDGFERLAPTSSPLGSPHSQTHFLALDPTAPNA